jgi:transposase, IS30 family
MERLTLEKRIRLETLLNFPMQDYFVRLSDNKKVIKISEMMGISESTIRREVRGRGFTFDNYNAKKAHIDSIHKVSVANTHYVYSEAQKTLILSEFKHFSIKYNWSPNSLILRLKSEVSSSIKLPSLEIMYQWIYEDCKNGGDLYKLLPHGQKKRRKQKSSKTVEPIDNKASIHNRDAVVNDRSRIGDIEIDSIVGPSNAAGMLTSLERKSRYVAATLVANKSGDETLARLLSMLLKHKKRLRTVTSDNGTEFAKHEQLAKALNISYYFADPYSSYQRGSNENVNGVIRRYFPKGTDFSKVTETELQQVIKLINHMPRKIHCGKTAHEVYYSVNKKLISAKHRNSILCAFRT